MISLSTELLKRNFSRKKNILETLRFDIVGNLLRFYYTHLKTFFKQKVNLKNWQCYLKRRPRKACTSLFLRLRQDYLLQRFVSHLHVQDIYIFLIKSVLIIRREPKEITQHHIAVSTITQHHIVVSTIFNVR